MSEHGASQAPFTRRRQHYDSTARAGALVAHHVPWVGHHTGWSRSTPTVHPCLVRQGGCGWLHHKKAQQPKDEPNTTMERWAKDGWVGTPPYFIAHTDAYHIITAPVLFSFDFVFAVRDDLARFLCDSFADMESVLTKLLRAKCWCSCERMCRSERGGFAQFLRACKSAAHSRVRCETGREA